MADVDERTLEFLWEQVSEASALSLDQLRFGKHGHPSVSWWRKVAIHVAVNELGAQRKMVAEFMARSLASVSQIATEMVATRRRHLAGRRTVGEPDLLKATKRVMLAMLPLDSIRWEAK